MRKSSPTGGHGGHEEKFFLTGFDLRVSVFLRVKAID